MRPSRYDDPERATNRVSREESFGGQRWPVYGLVIAAMNLGLGEPSMLNGRDRTGREIAAYLTYQVSCALAAASGLVFLLD